MAEQTVFIQCHTVLVCVTLSLSYRIILFYYCLLFHCVSIQLCYSFTVLPYSMLCVTLSLCSYTVCCVLLFHCAAMHKVCCVLLFTVLQILQNNNLWLWEQPVSFTKSSCTCILIYLMSLLCCLYGSEYQFQKDDDDYGIKNERYHLILILTRDHGANTS